MPPRLNDRGHTGPHLDVVYGMGVSVVEAESHSARCMGKVFSEFSKVLQALADFWSII